MYKCAGSANGGVQVNVNVNVNVNLTSVAKIVKVNTRAGRGAWGRASGITTKQ